LKGAGVQVFMLAERNAMRQDEWRSYGTERSPPIRRAPQEESFGGAGLP
jgi:hypothetical protein